MSFTSIYVSPTLQSYSHHRFDTKRIKLSKITKSFSVVNCSSSEAEDSGERGGGGSNSLSNVVSGMVDERVEQLLKKEENRVLLDGLEKATQRVELARKELSFIEQQEEEAKLARNYLNQLQSKTSEIADCQKEILEAKVMLEEAERSLITSSGSRNEDSISPMEGKVVDRNTERLESAKAATISAIIGTLAGLPLSVTRVTSNSELLLPLGITFVCCALFGVTFRYAVRRDLDDFQLKSGVCAAFGFVKGLGMLGAGPPLEFDMGSLLEHAFSGGFYVSENLLIFFFAAVGLDFSMKMKVLSPFPTNKSISKSNVV